jgi:hypothetical protein
MELARWEYRADMMVSAMTGRVKDMKVGREKDYLGDRVVLTSMPWGAVTGHQLSKLSRVWSPALPHHHRQPGIGGWPGLLPEAAAEEGLEDWTAGEMTKEGVDTVCCRLWPGQFGAVRPGSGRAME